MHQLTTFFQIIFGEWRPAIYSGMFLIKSHGSNCVIFKTYKSLFAFNDKKWKHRFEQMRTFSSLCGPSPERFSWHSVLQRWIPILRTVVDYPATAFFNMCENFIVRIGYRNRQRTIRIYSACARISYRSFVNAHTAFSVKESSEIASIHWRYID